MKTIKPPALRKGDKIGIISPSEPVIYKKEFSRGVETLKKLGFKVILGKNVFRDEGGYTAGYAKTRAKDLNAMIRDKNIKGIFASHGGFNSNELLDLIDYEVIKKNPKIIHGFSDITVLLNAIHAKTGLVTFHGQNIKYGFSRGFEKKEKYTLEYFLKAETIKQPIGPIDNKEPIKIIRHGKATGNLIGGNLSVLMTLIGTQYEPEWKGKILFWEELKQTKQDIQFFLTHLRLAGAFDKITGMAVGKLTGCNFIPKNPDWEKSNIDSFEKMILNITRNYKFPIINNLRFGHYHPQITIPIGVKATIDTSKKLFSIDEPAVI